MKLNFTFLLLLLSSGVFAQHIYDHNLPVKYRNIGPFRGGRSVTATGVVSDPLTYYFGTTGGGIWKTSDAGQHWFNISDGYFETGSVGAVSVSESNPNILYAGMGEHAPRGVMTSYGDGVYKSTDAGKTWKKLGLEKTQHISRIQIHPTNPDIVYVAAQGALHASNLERGVFKSIDGGETWDKVLFVDEKTGAVELSMDMHTPEVLYAAMWEHQRKPWQVISGGPGSGMYKTTDAGKTWKKIENGLPNELGKMAISVSRANPNKVYALVESDTQKDLGGLFVSDNAGESWTWVNKDNRLTQRAWYYIEIFADPTDENTVYVQSAPMLKSIDGGKTFETMDAAHGDYHDLWINPNNSKNMILADDGGGSISFDSGDSWSTQNNMPTAQIYRINTDNQFPYRIYGGQQDNTSLVISSIALGRGSISQENWNYSAGGESAFLAFDPDHPRYVLGGSYLGTIEVLDMENQASTNIMIEPIQYLGRETQDMKYRYNWNAPIIWSQHEPNTYYHAAQYLLKTTDMGQSWEVVSPDLTRNEKEKQGKGGAPYTNEAVGAENYGTLAYVIESPHEAGVIYTGSDDGLVYLTQDGGENWENITPKGLDECLINAIEVSAQNPGTVYIATTRYKFNDYTPALYKSTDYGKSWRNISSGIPYGAFTRVVREDSKDENLLFAGTELGMYISKNGGNSWTPFQLNLPITPITDLKIAHDDLVVATSGRSFWILDDLNIIREFDGQEEQATLFPPDPALLGNWYSSMNGSLKNFKGTSAFEGINPANGMTIYYFLPEKLNDSTHLSLEIHNSKGELIRKISSQKDSSFTPWAGGPPAEPTLGKNQGLNRFVWDFRHATMPGVPGVYIESNYRGHKAIPGTYQLTLKVDGKELKTDAEVIDLASYGLSPADYQAYDQFMSAGEKEVKIMHEMVNHLKAQQDKLKELLNSIMEKDDYTPMYQAGKELEKKLQDWDKKMIQRKSTAYDDVENFENKFTANFLFMLNHSDSSIPKVNNGTRKRKEKLMQEWEILKTEGENLLQTEVPAFEKMAQNAGLGILFVK